MKEKTISTRSPQEVFEDHLELAQKGEIEKDLKRNYSEESVLLTNYGTFHGIEGVKEAARLLNRQLPNGNFNYILKMGHNKTFFLHWSGDSSETYIENGADSFLIENGKIKTQTIFYTVHRKSVTN